jgi:hypothetical protein
MQRICGVTLAAVLTLGAAQAWGQSVVFDFEGGTDQGFGNKFSNDASASFPIVNIGGSQRMEVLRNGDFQEADISSGNNPYLAAFNAAVANPTGYLISYDWYVDTSLSPGNYGSFLQLGTYINAGQGSFPYVQDFPGVGKDVELNGTQLASGSVFSGTISETLTAKYGVLHPDFQNAPSQRLGFIINGDGSAATVYFDNIRITPVIPEPASVALAGLAVVGMAAMRRRSLRSI